MKEIQTDSVDCTDEFVSSVTRGATGRTTNFLSNAQYAEERSVLGWLESPDMGSHYAVDIFQNLIKNAEVLEEPTLLMAYRGKFIDYLDSYPMSDSFGPTLRAGRYNLEKVPTLYLSASRQGVAAELDHLKATDKILYCQDYAVPTTELRIANFASPNVSNFVQIAFDYAVHASHPGATDKRNYLFSQTLAQIVVKTGFSAMLVPGVRGSQDNRYNNLVVFSPGDSPGEQWKSWYCSDSPPVII